MPKLFDENFKYTKEAGIIDHEMTQRLEPIFKKYVEGGYSPRELGHIAQSVVNILELESIMTLDSARLKEKEKENGDNRKDI